MEHADHPGFELDEDKHQQAREWFVQRIAWVAFLIILAAIGLGIFGRGGPLSNAKATSPDDRLQIQYQRFMRHHSSDNIHLAILPTGAKTSIHFNNSYIKELEFSSITPTPEHTISEDGVLTFVFNTRANVPAELHFHVEPEKVGTMRGTVAMDGGTPVHFTQFVYP